MKELATTSNDEIVIDLLDVLRHLWQRKTPVIIAMILGAVIAGIIAANMRNIYQTEVLLAPAQNNAGALTQLAGQFGGLASLAGIGLGGKSDQLVDEGVALMTSREILLGFIHDSNLKPILFYGNWDKENNSWKKPGPLSRIFKKIGLGNKKTKSQKRYMPNEPTDWSTYQLFSKKFIRVNQEKKTSLITVIVSAYSPEDAMSWATEIVRRVNEHLRQAKKTEAEKSIAYLEKASQQTSVVEMKSAIYQLVENQTKTIMLANVKEEFAFRTVDPAYLPEKKAGPRRSLIVLGGAILGSSLAIAYLFIGYLRTIRNVTRDQQNS